MTFELNREHGWRYYNIDGKRLISIAFFDENGIVMQTDGGYLEYVEPNSTYKRDVKQLVLEKRPILKMKLDYKKLFADQQPFYAKGKIIRQYWTSDPGYILYLPYIPGDWSVLSTYTNHATTCSEFKQWLHRREGYIISVFQKSIPIEENIAFVKKVRELFEIAVYNKSEISDSSIIDNRAKITELIKNFGV